jgi:hypothetical protein
MFYGLAGNRRYPLTHEQGYRSVQPDVHRATVLRCMPQEFFREWKLIQDY